MNEEELKIREEKLMKQVKTTKYLVIAAIIIMFFLIGILCYKSYLQYNKLSNPDAIQVKVNDKSKVETNDQILGERLEKIYTLNGLNESVNFDSKLSIKFEGKEFDYGYKYNATIYVDNKEVKDTLFKNYNIHSEQFAASFKIVKIRNVYFLISETGMQCDGEYVLILKDDGTIIKSFDDVFIYISDDNESYKVTECDGCDIGSTCSEETYNI